MNIGLNTKLVSLCRWLRTNGPELVRGCLITLIAFPVYPFYPWTEEPIDKPPTKSAE